MDDVLFLSLVVEMFVACFPPTGTTERFSEKPLTDFISQYEPLYYDSFQLTSDHHRVKRTVDGSLQLDAHAYGRTFKMRLKRDTQVYSTDLVVENGTGGSVSYDSSRAYVGIVEDDGDSSVHGIVTTDGIFEGKIKTKDELYVVERARRYFKDEAAAAAPEVAVNFRSVIYKQSSVKMDKFNSSFCRSAELHDRLRSELQRHRTEESDSDPDRSRRTRRNGGRTPQGYAKPIGRYDTDAFGDRYFYRQQLRPIDPAKTTCTIYIQADHLFFEKFDRNEDTVIDQLTQHVQGVNEIYRYIDFDDNGAADNIHFIIKRIKIWTSPKSPGYKFSGNYGVETFLELLSEDNFDAFCLAYLFTYRDFDGGTLGLAWTGDLQNAGGVCEKNGQYRGSFKSLNSGLVTILNYGKDVPPSVSHVTMAHEVGHNIGSQHDPETPECSPGGSYGNYIMYARATSGDRPNNNKFSTCSKQAMAQVMAVKARGDQGCFIPSTEAICGNGVVEGDEECDCGWEDECHEKCCYPQVSSVRFGMPCTRKPGAQCSPSEGPCCSDKCQLIDNRGMCRSPTTCRSASYCNGSSAVCPPSFNRLDVKNNCEEDYTCQQGDCPGSICLSYDLEPCHCPPIRDLTPCRLCCKEAGDGKPCRSSNHWHIDIKHVPNTHDKSTGAHCSKRKGCHTAPKCTEGETEGPFASLRHLLFSAEVMKSMRHWFTVYWYIPAVVAAGFFASLAVLIKLCSGRKGIMIAGNSSNHLKMSYVEPHKTLNQGTNYSALSDQPQPTVSEPKRFSSVRLPPERVGKARPVPEQQPDVGGDGAGLREKGRREITSWV